MESEVFGASSSAVVVAHELKGPLSLSRQLALSLEFEDSLAGAREIGRQIATTSERALRQVEDLTRVARLDDALFEMEPVNPRIVCDEVVAELPDGFAVLEEPLEARHAVLVLLHEVDERHDRVDEHVYGHDERGVVAEGDLPVVQEWPFPSLLAGRYVRGWCCLGFGSDGQDVCT